MSQTAQVSVIVPTWNRAPLLSRALDSVRVQTHPPAEVIVVDDGSTDATRSLVNERFPRVRYLFQANGGVSRARNRGVAAARFPWLAFLDSDDEWHPRKLERQMAALARDPAARLCHSDEIWIRHGRRVNPGRRHRKYGGEIYERCLPLCALSPSSVVVHRDLLAEVGGFDESLPACEDYDLWLRLCARHRVLLVDEALVTKHGGHEDQLSRRFWGMDRFRIQALEGRIASGELDPAQRRATLETLVEKIGIYLQGVTRRRRRDEAQVYRDKRDSYRRLLTEAWQESAPP